MTHQSPNAMNSERALVVINEKNREFEQLVREKSIPISLSAAADGYAAAHDALYALAQAANNADERIHYANLMDAVYAEYKAVADKILEGSNEYYSKLIKIVKGAADELKQSLQKAKDLANALNLAAGVVSAFSKILPLL